MRNKNLLLAGLAIASSLLPLVAQAIPYGSNQVYKAVQSGRPYVFVGGQTPGGTLELQLQGVSRTQVRTADACGQVEVVNSSTNPLSGTVQIGNQSLNYGTVPTQLKPSCVNGTLSESRTAAYKTPEGNLIGVGFAASAPQNVVTTGPRVRRVTVNQCGFARFTGTTTAPFSDSTSFTFGGTNYTVGSLPDAMVGPRCNTIDGTARGFRPVGVGSW